MASKTTPAAAFLPTLLLERFEHYNDMYIIPASHSDPTDPVTFRPFLKLDLRNYLIVTTAG